MAALTPRREDVSLYLSIPVLIAAAIIQTVLISRVDIGGGRPDLMLLVVMIWAFVHSVEHGAIWALVGGISLDLMSGGPLGAAMLALVAVAAIAGQPWGLGIGSQVVRLLLISPVAIAAYHLVLLLILLWAGHTVDWEYSLLQVALPSVVLNVVLAPLVLRPLTWLAQRTRRAGF